MVLGASHHDLELTQLDRLTGDPDLLSRALGELVARRGLADRRRGGGRDLQPAGDLPRRRAVSRRDRRGDRRRRRGDRARAADEVSGLLKVRVGAPVAAHLFTVAAGLDSMVVGEAEIGGQIARAFRDAQAAGTASPAINLLFQSAARTAKQVATDTGLGAAGRSVASVALDIVGRSGRAAPVRGRWSIGTGAYARVVAAELRDPRLRRTVGASRPAAGPPGSPTGTGRRRSTPTDWPTRSPPPIWSSPAAAAASDVLDEELLATAVAGRDKPLPIIDLALHSDVSAAARSVPGIRVIDLHTRRRAGRPDPPLGRHGRPGHRDRRRCGVRGADGGPAAGSGRCCAAPTHLGCGGEGDGPAAGQVSQRRGGRGGAGAAPGHPVAAAHPDPAGQGTGQDRRRCRLPAGAAHPVRHRHHRSRAAAHAGAVRLTS